jgi:hypothetical protein
MALWAEDSLVAVRSDIEHLTAISLVISTNGRESVVILSVYSKIEADINLHCCGQEPLSNYTLTPRSEGIKGLTANSIHKEEVASLITVIPDEGFRLCITSTTTATSKKNA